MGAGFALSGLVAWWQLQWYPAATKPPGARLRLPDSVALQFAAVETDAAGKPSRRLEADELRHFVAENLSELDHPRLTLLQAADAVWHARARAGYVFADGDQVRLLGEVQLDRTQPERMQMQPDRTQPDRTESRPLRPAHLETERIDVWRERALAETELPVRIRSDGDSVSANGMQLWYAAPARTIFRGRARIRLEPERAPDSAKLPASAQDTPP